MENVLLKSKLEELKNAGVSNALCNKLEDYILNSDKSRLFGISPYRLAYEWNIDKHEALNAFLYASKAGIFDLEWNIRCPACKSSTEKTDKLKNLTSESHCDYCKIDINAGFDNDVEITFNINQNIRATGHVSIEEITMAWMKFEESVTFDVDPNSVSEMRMSLDYGNYYMLHFPQKTGVPVSITNDGIDDDCIEILFNGSNLKRKNTFKYNKGRKCIKLENKSNSPLEFIFTKAKEFPWVSGADIATNQFFRDYFSTELISSDETFSIKNMVFVFTDIKGSTDLYEKRGDSKAYYLVKEHFKIMNKIVSKHNGAIVKTIGDAVMATFMNSTDSVKAVFEMQSEFDKFNTIESSRDDIIIKIGLHRGGCLAVTSNDKLDYFGRTVNIAARIQGLSGGNDIMMSKELFHEHGIEEFVKEYNWKLRNIEATLKGIEGFYEVIHIYK